MLAVVGLGNPGRRYSDTRHNVGFLFIKIIAKAWNVRLRRRIFASKANYSERNGKKILLAKPQTYMNNSGVAVREIVRNGGVKLDDLVVVYDDLDIPLGEIRIRKEGSSGTHHGMGSIIQELSSSQFSRIRIGIGPLPFGEDAADYVLSPFTEEEKTKLALSLPKAQAALDLILEGQVEKAMNVYNARQNPDKDKKNHPLPGPDFGVSGKG